MKIVICGSMKLSVKMIEVGNKLGEMGHEPVLPRHTKEYAEMNTPEHIHSESVKQKVDNDLIRDYYNEIAKSDAVLIVNCDLNKVPGYIGGNSFLEVGFAHVLNKKVYFLNNIPDMIYSDELRAIDPMILNGDLSKIN